MYRGLLRDLVVGQILRQEPPEQRLEEPIHIEKEKGRANESADLDNARIPGQPAANQPRPRFWFSAAAFMVGSAT